MSPRNHHSLVPVKHVAVGVALGIAVSTAMLATMADSAEAAEDEASQLAPMQGPVPATPQRLADLAQSSAIADLAEGSVGPLAVIGNAGEIVADPDIADSEATGPAVEAPDGSPAPIAPAPAPPPVDLTQTPSGYLTPIAHYYFSARFGQPGPWSSGRHTGTDFVTKFGSPVRAPADGIIKAAAPAGAYGNLIQLKIAERTQLWFAHLSQFRVRPGDKVERGEIIGLVGVTGNTSGPHLHFEYRVKGQPRDAERFFWPTSRSVTRIR